MAENEVVDEAAEPAASVEPKAVEEPSADTPKPVKRKKAKEPAITGPTAAAQAALGVEVTGSTNHATKAAVRAFQRSRGLTVHGRLDDATKAALGI